MRQGSVAPRGGSLPKEGPPNVRGLLSGVRGIAEFTQIRV